MLSLSCLESLALYHQPLLAIPYPEALQQPGDLASRNRPSLESKVAGSRAAQTAVGTCPVLPGRGDASFTRCL